MRPSVRLPLALLVLGALAYLTIAPPRPLPPVARFLDPVRGVWAVARDGVLPRQAAAMVPGLDRRVRVFYDRRGVPHIFATTELDAYRALGYVVARDRLFQLDVQARAATGTLSELVGAAALPLDREVRALGLPRAAKQQRAAVDTTSASWRAVEAYTAGVNAYIDELGTAQLPLEYRLLGARPQRWRPLYSLALIDQLGLTLAYNETELRRLRLAGVVGDRAADALIPVNAPLQEPIVPNGAVLPRLDSTPLPPPGPPDTAARSLALALDGLGTLPVLASRAGTDAVLGSNNWAVSPRRTRDKYALLAGDPHLELTLPSIWYEVHLSVPGVLDEYGVTIPGAPSIILGFNRSVAWTFTNTGADVLDFYAESVDVAAHPTRYLVDGTWRPLTQRIEQYRSPNGTLLATDTVRYTYRGPLRRAGSRWLSMRWTVLEPHTVLAAFAGIGHATSVDAWLDSMRTFGAPAQNMLVADRTGTIAIRSTGEFPLRPGNGRGDIIRDGTTSRSDWTGTVPLARYPMARDPAQGFLASANQQPADPRTDSTYFGSDWPAPWRAMRINALLRGDSLATMDSMRVYQTDPGSARADLFVPYVLNAAVQRLRATPDDSVLRQASDLLVQWDRRYTDGGTGAVLFELTMRELRRRLWDELVERGDSMPVVQPGEAVTAQLLAQPTNVWWDDRGTADVVETRDVILAASLRAAYLDAQRLYGDPALGGWAWSRVQHYNIYHLLHLPSLSRLDLPVEGGPGTLSPASGGGTAGPSWRMVVELGPDVQGWGSLPGGESGNPASPRYDNQLRTWVSGTLQELYFPPDSIVLARPPGSPALTLDPRGAR